MGAEKGAKREEITGKIRRLEPGSVASKKTPNDHSADPDHMCVWLKDAVPAAIRGRGALIQ